MESSDFIGGSYKNYIVLESSALFADILSVYAVVRARIAKHEHVPICLLINFVNSTRLIVTNRIMCIDCLCRNKTLSRKRQPKLSEKSFVLFILDPPD